jgi:ATP-binding cassette subfamily F protein 3
LSLIQLDQITRYYGDKLILSSISATIERGDKIGLVGPNGAGKTTLLALLVEEILPDTGSLRKAGQCRIGYLPQRSTRTWDLTLRHLLMQELTEIREMDDALRELEKSMASPDVYENPQLLDEVMGRYGRLQDQFRHLGGYSYEVKMKQVIYGLGFTSDDLDRSVREFSGGEQVRAELARVLLAEPDLLLLDEPTNHLDIQATEWLEGYLRSLSQAVVVVSHDRYFLDMICTRIWELDDHQLYQYPSNFSRFLELRRERLARQEADYQAVTEEAKRLEEYINRYRAGNRAKQAQSREKRLAKLQPAFKPTDNEAMRLDLSYETHTVKQVLITEDLDVGYGEKPLISGLELSVLRGERWGIIGPNGVGKSTLLKVLANDQPAIGGTFRWGDGVSVGYFRQGLDNLDTDNTILDEMLETRNLPVGEMRNFLARFLFTGDTVFNRIGSLSGGERCRVALAKLLLAQPNVLLLDEPTNHLDIVSRETLEQALANFTGTLILVTHDRYLLDKLVTNLLILESGSITFFSGNYSSFREHKKQEQVETIDTKVSAQRRPLKDIGKGSDADQKKDLAELEEIIVGMEEELQSLTEQMADPEIYVDGPTIRTISLRHREISEELETLYERWEGLFSELESRNPVA